MPHAVAVLMSQDSWRDPGIYHLPIGGSLVPRCHRSLTSPYRGALRVDSGFNPPEGCVGWSICGECVASLEDPQLELAL